MTNDFLFHKISEKEKSEIKKQAKQIMDSFSNTLNGARKLSKVGKVSESLIEREECARQEGKEKCSENFSREIMFENAPDTLKGTSKNKDFIVAERGEW